MLGGTFNIFDIGETNRDLSSALVTIHLIFSYSHVIYKGCWFEKRTVNML